MNFIVLKLYRELLSGQAAVGHNPQVLVVIGHRRDAGIVEQRVGQLLDVTVGGVVQETDIVDVVISGGLA